MSEELEEIKTLEEVLVIFKGRHPDFIIEFEQDEGLKGRREYLLSMIRVYERL